MKLRIIPLLAVLLAAAPAVSQTADDLELLLAQAMDRQQSGDLLGAIQAYRVILQSAPERADVRSNLGAAYIKLGRFDEGMHEYREALRIDPDNPTYRFNLGLALYKSGRPDIAIPEFRAVVGSDASNQAALLLLADCLIQMGQDAEVVALLSPHETVFAADLAYAYLLGTALVRSGERDRGQMYIDRIFKAGETAEGHLLMGLAHMSAHDYKGAVTEFARAVELNPQVPRGHSLYGRALLSSGDQEGANRQFLRALEANPNDFDATLQLGGLRQRDQRYDEALSYLNRAAAIRTDDPTVRHALAGVYLGKDDAARAAALLEGVVKDVPEHIDAHVLLATAYYRLKRKDDGDRQRELVAKLTAERQSRQPGAQPPATQSAPRPPDSLEHQP